MHYFCRQRPPQVENATGYAVIWNRTGRFLMEDLEDFDESTQQTSGRALYGRRWGFEGERSVLNEESRDVGSYRK